MSEVIVVLCTCTGAAEADRIAEALVGEGLAACVNIVAGVKSIYRWEGKIETASEYLLVIKTTSERWAPLENRVIQLHSYETPEMLRVSIEGGAEKYLAWVKSSVAGGRR